MNETHKRSILKGVTWRIIASGTTMVVVYVVTGNLTLVASVGIIDIVAKIFFYYLHERTWGKVKWGVLGTEPKINSCDCDCHTVAKVAG
jgi:adenylylsulfate kinase